MSASERGFVTPRHLGEYEHTHVGEQLSMMQAGCWQELLRISAEAQMCNRQLAERNISRCVVAVTHIVYTLQAVSSNSSKQDTAADSRLDPVLAQIHGTKLIWKVPYGILSDPQPGQSVTRIHDTS